MGLVWLDKKLVLYSVLWTVRLAWTLQEHYLYSQLRRVEKDNSSFCRLCNLQSWAKNMIGIVSD
jgi:hypothetical protein